MTGALVSGSRYRGFQVACMERSRGPPKATQQNDTDGDGGTGRCFGPLAPGVYSAPRRCPRERARAGYMPRLRVLGKKLSWRGKGILDIVATDC
jgi:hypothetical protein